MSGSGLRVQGSGFRAFGIILFVQQSVLIWESTGDGPNAQHVTTALHSLMHDP